MKFNIMERIVLSQILPTTGTILNLKMLRELKEQLGFTDEENKEFNLRVEGEQLLWEGDKEIEIEIGDTLCALIHDHLKDMDDKAELTENHISLWDKFVENK